MPRNTVSIVVLALCAGTARAAPQDELARVRAECVGSLIALAQHGLEEQLFNDAQRLLLEAQERLPEEARIAALLVEQRRRVAARAKSPEREVYRQFLQSPDYAKARRNLARREKALREKAVAGYLAVIRAALAGEGTERLEEAVRRAHALIPADAVPRSLRAKPAVKVVLERIAEERSLEQLHLGAPILGPEITLEDLRGKVVLWRSFSL